MINIVNMIFHAQMIFFIMLTKKRRNDKYKSHQEIIYFFTLLNSAFRFRMHTQPFMRFRCCWKKLRNLISIPFFLFSVHKKVVGLIKALRIVLPVLVTFFSFNAHFVQMYKRCFFFIFFFFDLHMVSTYTHTTKHTTQRVCV